MSNTQRIAIVGDMHLQFDEADVAFFNASDYDAILLVGDLGSKNPDSLFRLLPLINALTKPVFLIPGNHDTTGVRALIGEVTHNQFLINLGASSQPGRMQRLRTGLTTATLCGYSAHELPGGLGLVAARPFSMGTTQGPHSADTPVNFRPFVEKEYGIGTMGESTNKLKALIDGINPPYLILAHHGPYGLGSKPTDMFGADFLPQETDFGDRDLADAIEYAVSKGKPPLAVIAGHMHYPTKHGKKPKQWWLRRDGILYVNAARWPRIFKHEGDMLRHHVKITLTAGSVQDVTACYTGTSGMRETRDDRATTPGSSAPLLT